MRSSKSDIHIVLKMNCGIVQGWRKRKWSVYHTQQYHKEFPCLLISKPLCLVNSSREAKMLVWNIKEGVCVCFCVLSHSSFTCWPYFWTLSLLTYTPSLLLRAESCFPNSKHFGGPECCSECHWQESRKKGHPTFRYCNVCQHLFQSFTYKHTTWTTFFTMRACFWGMWDLLPLPYLQKDPRRSIYSIKKLWPDVIFNGTAPISSPEVQNLQMLLAWQELTAVLW